MDSFIFSVLWRVLTGVFVVASVALLYRPAGVVVLIVLLLYGASQTPKRRPRRHGGGKR